MMTRRRGLRLSMIGVLASFFAAAAAGAADQKPEESPCQKLTGADRTECERRIREQEEERAAAPRPEPDQEPPPDTRSEGNDDSDTADPPRP